MIADLKPYPAYKDSGVPWLGPVPEHWEVRRGKALREVDDRTHTGAETLLSLRMHRGLVGHLAAGGKPIPHDALVGYKRTRPGEIVMNRMRAAAADSAYQNARKNSDRQNARIEHDKALVRVMTAVLKDDTQLFKEFSDNESFRRWLTDTVFGLTYRVEAT